jgi:glycerophosphoryl diester phosphodiesterase
MSECAPLPTRGVCAHRGGAAGRPENTLSAFREAVALGAHQVEFDVRRSADGEIVVVHDASVDRTTDGRGRVAAHTFAELRRLDAGSWWGDRFRGERIPTLAEALDVLPEDVWINIQIKRREPLGEDVARAVVESGRRHQVLVACGNDAARRVRAVCAELRICNLARQKTRAAYVEHAIAVQADFIQFHYLRGPVEPALAERAHRAGLRVNLFCGPGVTATQLEADFAAGVDFVLVDDLPLALRVAQRLGIAPVPRCRDAASVPDEHENPVRRGA